MYARGWRGKEHCPLQVSSSPVVSHPLVYCPSLYLILCPLSHQNCLIFFFDWSICCQLGVAHLPNIFGYPNGHPVSSFHMCHGPTLLTSISIRDNGNSVVLPAAEGLFWASSQEWWPAVSDRGGGCAFSVVLPIWHGIFFKSLPSVKLLKLICQPPLLVQEEFPAPPHNAEHDIHVLTCTLHLGIVGMWLFCYLFALIYCDLWPKMLGAHKGEGMKNSSHTEAHWIFSVWKKKDLWGADKAGPSYAWPWLGCVAVLLR
jgi:hypothetical protein